MLFIEGMNNFTAFYIIFNRRPESPKVHTTNERPNNPLINSRHDLVNSRHDLVV